MCGTIDPGHTCDEYLVFLAKSGMTPRNVAKKKRDEASQAHMDQGEEDQRLLMVHDIFL
jgi:hypothetical protein